MEICTTKCARYFLPRINVYVQLWREVPVKGYKLKIVYLYIMALLFFEIDRFIYTRRKE